MTEHWIEVVAVDVLPEDDVTGLEVAGRNLALYKVEGQVYATHNICTHGHARLCDGFLDGFEIECPLHQGKFDIRNGKAMCGPLTEDVQTYPVKTENGQVFIDLSELKML